MGLKVLCEQHLFYFTRGLQIFLKSGYLHRGEKRFLSNVIIESIIHFVVAFEKFCKRLTAN